MALQDRYCDLQCPIICDWTFDSLKEFIMKGRILNEDQLDEVNCIPRFPASTLPGQSKKYGQDFKDNINSIDFNGWPLDLLTVYIEKECHRYLKEQLPVLYTSLQRIRKTKAGNNKKFDKICLLFTEVSVNLSAYMAIEETKIFPIIKSLAGEHISTVVDEHGALDQVYQLSRDHELIMALFRKIRTYSNNYTPIPCARNTFDKTFALLKAFHEDLYFHIQLETEILFPKALLQYEQYKKSVLVRAKAPPCS